MTENNNEEKKEVYYFKDNYRFVHEYEFCYTAYVKQRWKGEEIFKHFSKEFSSYDQSYFENAILNGKILVNKKKVSLTYKLKMRDFIQHFTIRNEPPVYNKKINIIYEDEKLLVVDKPASMPVHPSGNYFHNSLQMILENEHGYRNIYAMHRIDKFTSGLVLFSKGDKKQVTAFHASMDSQEIHKTYLAKVRGKFTDEITVDKPLYCICHKKAYYDVCEPDEIEEKKGKNAKSKFKLRKYDEKENISIVECFPITGKTHQIRVHLKSLGFPIFNDTKYTGENIGNLWVDYQNKQNNNNIEAKKQTSTQQNINEKEQKELEQLEVIQKKVKKDGCEVIDQSKQTQESSISQSKKTEQESKDEKQKLESQQIINLNTDDQLFEICLHSLTYKYNDKLYSTELPYWALDLEEKK